VCSSDLVDGVNFDRAFEIDHSWKGLFSHVLQLPQL